MKHLDAEAVRRLLPMPAAIQAARDTATTVADGRVYQADRVWHAPPGMPGRIGVMPSYLPAEGDAPALFVTKLVGVFPAATPSVDGVIVVTDGDTGRPLVTVDAGAVTAARTAANSGLSVDLLARPEATTVALVGAGVQAWAHLRAVTAVRPVDTLRVWNRTGERAEALADRARGLDGITDVRVGATVADATRDADIVCVCTNSPDALVTAPDIAPGTHVTAIGAFSHDTRELGPDLMAKADAIVVDDRTAAAHEAGDILMAVAEGAITPGAVTADLAELVTGRVRIDRQWTDVTIYKSVGTSAMDAVAVRFLLGAHCPHPGLAVDE